MTLQERQKNDSSSKQQPTVEDLQVKLDAALDRIKKQESVISGYETQISFFNDVDTSAKNMAQEIQKYQNSITEKNAMLASLEKSGRTKTKMLLLLSIICLFCLVGIIYALQSLTC